jgi:hypothetical protein
MVAASRGCSVWLPDLQPGESVQWSGPCRNGTANGTGELLRKQGDNAVTLIRARFSEGRAEGPSNVTLPNGGHLETEFAGGVATAGTIRFGDASVYQGAIRNYMPNGRGSRSWPRGPEYDGNWVDGVRSGEGRQQDYLGLYSGQWRNDKRNGQGMLVYRDGGRYEGMWRDDRRSGQGRMSWQGGVYEGEWRNDKRNGQGTETYRTGGRYTGQFVEDLPEGPGTLVNVDGRRFEGRVSGGCFIAQRGENDTVFRPLGIGTSPTAFRILPGPGAC